MSLQKNILVGFTLSAMLGGVFATSLPQVNIVASKGVKQIKPTENTVTYSYEAANPLQLISYDNSTIAYNQGIEALQYNAQNDIAADDHGNTLSYDAMGEMISFTNAQTNQQVTYQYDIECHQSSETVEDTKGSSQTSQVFYYSSADQAQLMAESDSDGNQLSYLFAENKMGSINNTDQASLYITDQAGSVIALASNSGITHQYLYSPYGIMTDMDQSTTKAKNAQGFDGQRTDSATGYQFLGNGYRAYNPILHRFMQMDDIHYSPFGKGGINGYVFADNNPIINFDPSGHNAWSIINYVINSIIITVGVIGMIASGTEAGITYFPAMLNTLSGIAGEVSEAQHSTTWSVISSTLGFIGSYGAYSAFKPIIFKETVFDFGESGGGFGDYAQLTFEEPLFKNSEQNIEQFNTNLQNQVRHGVADNLTFDNYYMPRNRTLYANQDFINFALKNGNLNQDKNVLTLTGEYRLYTKNSSYHYMGNNYMEDNYTISNKKIIITYSIDKVTQYLNNLPIPLAM